MIDINDLITNGYGGIQIQVSLDDLMTFASTLLQGMQNKPAKHSEPDDDLMTRQEVMKYLDIKQTTLYNWAKQEILKPITINRKCYYRKSDILALQRGETKY